MALCIFYSIAVHSGESADFAQRTPVKWEKVENLAANPRGALRIPVGFKERPEEPLVIEAEDATSIGLHSSERVIFDAEAGGGRALREVAGLSFEFELTEPGAYSMWIRLKPADILCGPHHESVDGVVQTYLPTRREDRPGKWQWVKASTHELGAGKHTWSFWGDFFLYGAVTDRVIITSDPNFKPNDEEVGPPATSPPEVKPGLAESASINIPEAKRWGRLIYRSDLAGGKVNWAFRAEGSTDWIGLDPRDITTIPSNKPFQLRVELIPDSESGRTPWVDTVQLVFVGPSRTQEIIPGVTYQSLPDGGCVVESTNYRIEFAPSGRIEIMRVGSHEAIQSGREPWKGAWLEWNRFGNLQEVPLAGPELEPDGSIAVRGDEVGLLYVFTPDAMELQVSCAGGKVIRGPGALGYGFKIPADVERIVDRTTGRVASGTQGFSEYACTQIFFPDGANFWIEPQSGIFKFDGPEGPWFAMTWLNTANPWTKKFVFHAKPTPADAMGMRIEAKRPDHVFPAGEPLNFVFTTALRYGLSLKGEGRVTLEGLYRDKEDAVSVTETKALEIPGGTTETQTEWSLPLEKAGLYRGLYEVIEGGQTIRSLKFFALYAPEELVPPPRPADFKDYWKRTMDSLAATPLNLVQEQIADYPESATYRLKFSTIAGKPAWAFIGVPKKPGKCPAKILLPPVGTPAPVPGETKDFVIMGVEVRGMDPTLSEEEARKSAPVRYFGPGEVEPSEKREDIWTYYSYATMARAFDILASHPSVDAKRIYITGASQGGGLTMVLAGLRPENAGALAVVPGLCRLDWRSANGGGWGPGAPQGLEFERILNDIRYFDACNFMPEVRSRLVITIGLWDDHTPPHAAASAFNAIPDSVKEKRLIVGPWLGHGGTPELEEIIPRWAKEDEVK